MRFSLVRWGVLAATLSTPLALADEADAGVAAPTAAVAQAADAGVPTAAVPDVPWFELFRIYGTVKPTIIWSDTGVESFGRSNATATTAAGNPVMAALVDQSRLTFQAAQTRFGFWVNEKGAYRGQLEFDFLDFGKASATTGANPRVRIATAQWVPSDKFALIVGQDWDLYAPVNPHGSNLVGARFESGNSGFMRQQVKAIGRVGDFELGGAVGLAGNSNAERDGPLELGAIPTFALRGAWVVNKASRVGISALITQIRFTPGTATSRNALAGAMAAHADLTFAQTNVRGEVYLARNGANLGMLTLGQGYAGADVDEWGGFVSLRQGITAMHFIYANAGYAHVLNPSKVKPAYSYASLPSDGSPPAASGAALALANGPGILTNVGGVLGYELRLSKNWAFMLEGFFFATHFALTDFDAARFPENRATFGAELCAMLNF